MVYTHSLCPSCAKAGSGIWNDTYLFFVQFSSNFLRFLYTKAQFNRGCVKPYVVIEETVDGSCDGYATYTLGLAGRMKGDGYKSSSSGVVCADWKDVGGVGCCTVEKLDRLSLPKVAAIDMLSETDILPLG